MDFDSIKMYKGWVEVANWIVAILVNVQVLALLRYTLIYWWNRRRWFWFEKNVIKWVKRDDEKGLPYPGLLCADDQKAYVTLFLLEAGFEPTEIKDLLEGAVNYVKGRYLQEEGGISEPRPNPKG